eukprot:1140939-Pelagomonas_calceolata.AAC.2
MRTAVALQVVLGLSRGGGVLWAPKHIWRTTPLLPFQLACFLLYLFQCQTRPESDNEVFKAPRKGNII